jgi:hypothetical protein
MIYWCNLAFLAKDIYKGDIMLKTINAVMKYRKVMYFVLFAASISLNACSLLFSPLSFVATPTFSPGAGTYPSGQEVRLLCQTKDAILHYTVDGTNPTTNSPAYVDGNPIVLTSSTSTIKAIAAKEGMTTSSVATGVFVVEGVVAAPAFSPAAGTYATDQSVTLTSSTSGASIYYTTNGATPTTGSTPYTAPIAVQGNGTSISIKAVAAKAGMTNSSVSSGTFAINYSVVAAPAFSPAAGAYATDQSVTLTSSTSGVSIYYTTNGAVPTTNSAPYTGAIAVQGNGTSVTIKAIATKAGMTNSSVSSGTFTINYPVVAAPTFSPAAGTYKADQSVTLTSSTGGSSIYYTTNGDTPTTGSTPYTAPIPVQGNGTSKTIKAIAAKAGMTTSGVSTAAYVISYPGTVASTVAGYEVAKESVLRGIPTSFINQARTSLHVAYFHTSHGSHVAYGLYGLQDYKAGDDTLFGVSTSAAAGKLDFQDYYGGSGGYDDLSEADTNWGVWVNQVRTYLNNDANDEINVMMWSWCDISGHDVSGGYLPSMQTLIHEYGPGGTKIGTGTGKTKTTPVTFVFMTGHAYWDNENPGRPKNQADLITAYCLENQYLCLDYYSIDSHDMDGTYWSDASDDSDSELYAYAYNAAHGTDYDSRKFYADWQSAHSESVDWFYNKSSPGGSQHYGEHLSQHITSNRKAYAMWYILARITGWDGN